MGPHAKHNTDLASREKKRNVFQILPRKITPAQRPKSHSCSSGASVMRYSLPCAVSVVFADKFLCMSHVGRRCIFINISFGRFNKTVLYISYSIRKLSYNRTIAANLTYLAAYYLDFRVIVNYYCKHLRLVCSSIKH